MSEKTAERGGTYVARLITVSGDWFGGRSPGTMSISDKDSEPTNPTQIPARLPGRGSNPGHCRRVSPRRSHHHKPFFVHITGTGKSTPDMAQSGIFGVGGNELQWKVLAEEGAWRRGSPIHKNLLLVSEIRTALDQPRDFSSWCLSENPNIEGTKR